MRWTSDDPLVVVALLLTTPLVASRQNSSAGNPSSTPSSNARPSTVSRYMDVMSGLTAEERYVQDLAG